MAETSKDLCFCVTGLFHKEFSFLAQRTPKNSKKVCRYFRGGLHLHILYKLKSSLGKK